MKIIPTYEKGRDTLENFDLSHGEHRFLTIQNLDRTFASTVIKKGFATQHQVSLAMEEQRRAFKKHRKLNLLGDVMVNMDFLIPGQRNLILVEQQRMEEAENQTEQETGIDGLTENPISVTVSLDAMEAWAHISDTEGSPPSLAQIKESLGKKEIVHGILKAELLQCCLDKRMPRFILAKGDLPVVAGGTRLKYLFDPREQSARVDRGSPLAEMVKIEQGVPGRDVFGNTFVRELVHRKEPSVFNCGRGARIARDRTGVFAGTNGTPFLSILGQLRVFPAVNVLDDADMRFGVIETHAALAVSGILTGAYPVKAGTVTAGEIRETRLESLGDITVAIGITNAVINTQGSIRARYIHNCTIEAFGDVIVEHEILDSTITIGGRCLSPKGRIIASTISARQGVTAGSVGSDVTEPCHISAAREEHLIVELQRVETEIDLARQALHLLEKNIKEMDYGIAGIFKKMVHLKRLYDRARAEKTRHQSESCPESDEEISQTKPLIAGLDKKLASILNFLKELDRRKKTMEQALELLKEKKTVAEQKMIPRVQALERKRFRLLDWNRQSQGVAEISVNGSMAQGTHLAGPFSSTVLKETYRRVTFTQTRRPGSVEKFEFTCKKIPLGR
ncbi:MAG: FapA family protein [Desulfobacterium sp.]|nr:FapA family protein [Desulfobacterium sp.]